MLFEFFSRTVITETRDFLIYDSRKCSWPEFACSRALRSGAAAISRVLSQSAGNWVCPFNARRSRERVSSSVNNERRRRMEVLAESRDRSIEPGNRSNPTTLEWKKGSDVTELPLSAPVFRESRIN